MAKSTPERMAAYRLRQRLAGLATLSLVVPKDDAGLFREFAAERRRMKTSAAGSKRLRKRWFSVLDIASPKVAPTPAKSILKRGAGERSKSRGELLAESILKQIIGMGWPVGRPLGSETELMKQFGISRPVLRQTVRLLEHHAIAHMQRGAGGGLVVGAPDAGATARAVSIYLEYRRIGPADILQIRRILEQAAVSLAVERLTEAGEHRLRDDVAAEDLLDGNAAAETLQRFHFTVAELSGDPALSLFAGIALHLSDAHSNFSRRSREDRDKVVRRIRKLHRSIAQAMIERDTAVACQLTERYLNGYKEWLE